MSEQITAPLPLAGVTVIELGMVLAGPFAGSLLADLGATIIKVEPPGVGDPMRQMGPQKNGVSLWWSVGSRGKKCITLNLKDSAACALFERLVKQADVLVENYRPGVLDRLGLGWEHLHEINPQLVMLSITGFGQTGPDAVRPGFGKIAEGISGLVPLTGSPGENPVFVGYSLADTTTALFGVFAINLALYLRDIQGAGGAYVDVSLYEPLFRMMEAQVAMREAIGRAPSRTGSNDPYGWGRSIPRDPLVTFVKSCVGEWIEVLLPAIARARIAELANAGSNPADRGLFAALCSWAEHKTSQDIRDALQHAGAKTAPVLDGLSVAKLEYFLERGDVIAVADPVVGSFHVPGFFLKHYQRPGDTARFDGPEVGAHNQEIFIERLGLTRSELDKLVQQGAI